MSWGVEHLPELGAWADIRRNGDVGSRSWGRSVFLQSECPERELNGSFDVREVQWPEWVVSTHTVIRGDAIQLFSLAPFSRVWNRQHRRIASCGKAYNVPNDAGLGN